MRVPTLFAAVLVPTVALAAAGDDTKVAADLKAMVGKWKVEKAEVGGKDITDFAKQMQFEIRDGGKYTTVIGDEKDVGTFTVDPSKSPKELDVKPTGGPNKGKTVKGIYKIDGDTLTVCYGFEADKAGRPTKFDSKAGDKTLLMTYKREKK
jgi:uncharacterized protein (TIGR03067 family)